ncbi:MAG: ZIP family metal transporter [Rhodospirillales bacterium]|nr:ZIP family metal transporter [Rhodospirillales bacterium]
MTLADVLPFTIVPVLAAGLGAALVAWRPPSEKAQSFVQHFASGVVFAAAAAELLPDLVHRQSLAATLIGAALGVALMLAIREVSRKLQGSFALTAVIGVDVLVDGLVVGLGFAQGARQGILLTIALSIELLFLALTVSSELGDSGMSKRGVVAASVGLSLLLPVGSLFGIGVLAGLPDVIVTALYAFALVALLYLVTEELLLEAHERPDTPLATAVFFVGFFLMITIDRLMA